MAHQEATRLDVERGPRRNEGVAMNAALGIDRQSLIDAGATVVSDALRHPVQLLRAGASLQSELLRIVLGTSEITINQSDERFADEAWDTNPFFKRIGQAYFAWTRSLDDWLANASLEGIEEQRARFILSILKDISGA